MLAQRLSVAEEILAKLGGRCAAEYKYDGMRVQAHRTADGEIELFTRRQERVSAQFPDVLELLTDRARAAGGDRRGRGDRVRSRRQRAAAVRRSDVPPPQARDRRGGAGRAGRPVLLRAAVRRRRGPDHAAVSGAAGPARRGGHPLGPAAAHHGGRRGHAARRWTRCSTQAVADGAEGLVCKATGAESALPGRQPRLVLDQAETRLPHGTGRHRRPGGGRGVRRARPTDGNVRRGAAGRL